MHCVLTFVGQGRLAAKDSPGQAAVPVALVGRGSFMQRDHCTCSACIHRCVGMKGP